MNAITRRHFLKTSARLSVLFGLGASAIPRVAEALDELAQGLAPVLWLQGQCCSGCSVSLLDSEAVTPVKLLTRYISLGFHQTLSAATGSQAVEVVNKISETGGHILIVEGAVPEKMPLACTFGDEPFAEQLVRAARKAKAILTAGSCSCYGGIPAAENNPTGAVAVPAFLKKQGIDAPSIRVPGCPIHPDWLVGTVVHTLKFGLPPVDGLGRPKAYFGKSMHEQCPRFNHYELRTFRQDLWRGRLPFQARLRRTGHLHRLQHLGAGTAASIPASAPARRASAAAAKIFAPRQAIRSSPRNAPCNPNQPRMNTDEHGNEKAKSEKQKSGNASPRRSYVFAPLFAVRKIRVDPCESVVPFFRRFFHRNLA